MRSLKKTFILTLIMTLILSCINPIVSEAATVKLNKKSVTLEVGQSTTIKLTGAKAISWGTGSGVAKYKASGSSMKITGKQAGTTTVTAYASVNGKIKKYTCKITVKSKPVINVTATLNVTGLKDDWRRYYTGVAPEDHLVTLFKGDKGKFSFTTTSNPKITSDKLTNIKYSISSSDYDYYKKYLKLSPDGTFEVISAIPRKDHDTDTVGICATAEYKGKTVNIAFSPYEYIDSKYPEIASERLIQAFDKVEQVSKQIITPDMNDAEKVLAVHDWICLNTTYNFGLYTGEDFDGDLPGVMLDGSTVCNGYTEAFSAFMQYLGIEERQINGPADYHIWNQVKLDGEWYFIDCTWDDAANLIGYNYFLQSGKHTEDEVLNCKYEPNGRDDNTDCLATGTYWRYKVFEKYKASSEAEARTILNNQVGNPIVRVLFYNMHYMDANEIGNRIAREYNVDDFGIDTIVYNGTEYYLYSYDLT